MIIEIELFKLVILIAGAVSLAMLVCLWPDDTTKY
jgi:hypothetical protein